MTLAIDYDTGIPMPPRSADGRGESYPWKTMPVGASFLLRIVKAKRPDSSAAGSTSMANTRHAPKRFEWRRTDAGYRVWRVK